MSKRISQCKSNCSATNPNVSNYDPSLLPEKVRERLKELGLDQETLRRCSYCGDIWIEKFERAGDSFRERVIKVGIDDHIAGEGMIWKILE